MMPQPPQWPSRPRQPAQPDQSPGSNLPRSRLAQAARSRLGLAAVAVVSSLLIVALLCTLVLVLASNARGTTAGNQAQTGQNGQTGQPQNGQAATVGTSDGSGAGSGGTPASGGGKTQPTATPPGQSATPTPTSGIAVVGGCCLTLGSPSVHQVASQSTLSGSSVGPAVATCPSGELALSGGWSIPPHAGALVYSSARANTRSWEVYVRHESSVDVTAYAECLANASGASIVGRTTYKSVAPGAHDDTGINCNAGEVLVGGGFYSETGMVVYISNEYTANTWTGTAKNFGSTSSMFSVSAECLTYANAHSSFTAKGLSSRSVTPGSGGRAASPTCPSGTYVSGGGFIGPWGIFYDTAAEGSGDTTTWAVYDYNNTEDDNAYVSSEAVCLGF